MAWAFEQAMGLVWYYEVSNFAGESVGAPHARWIAYFMRAGRCKHSRRHEGDFGNAKHRRFAPARRTRCEAHPSDELVPPGDQVVHLTRLLHREPFQMVTAIQQPGHCLWRVRKPLSPQAPLTNRLALMTDGDWRDGGFRQRRPSVETLAWVAASMGRGSRIVGYRRLTGGVCSAVNRLTVERRGMRTFVVLRQYPGGLGLQGSLEKEIANLGVVAGSGLPVPSILATDVAGASTGGAPSLLMTRLQGHVHLNPPEPRSWMTRIAEIAVLLHSLDLPAKMFRPWTDSWIAPLDGFQVPVDAQKPAVWKAAFGVMAAPPPKDTAVFLHCDLLPVNMLWSRGRITGLTDWNSIHRGARAIDVGHCRRYLAALYSPEWSEQLRSLYESIAGVTLDPWWDLYALLHYDDSGPKWIRSQVAGRRPADVPGMTSRVEVAIETALRRLG